MLDAIAAAAWERPRTFLAVAAGVLVVLALPAVGTPDELGHGPPSPGEPDRADLLVATTTRGPLGPQVESVALEAIASNLEADPGVSAVKLIDRAPHDGTASIEVTLESSDAGERRAVARRVEAKIDPGPLDVYVGGRIAELEEARTVVEDDLWRLELLVLPLAALALLGVLGGRLGPGPVACTAIAVTGALAGLRLAAALGDPSPLAIVASAGVGLVLGIELPALLAARWEDERSLAEPQQALRFALQAGMPAIGFAATAAAVAPAGLLLTSYGPAGSILLGCALASVWALLACVLVMPALFALSAQAAHAGEDPERERRLAAALSTPSRVLARARWRCLLGAAAALAACLTLGYPVLGSHGEPLDASALPRDSDAAHAARIVTAAERDPDPGGAAGGDKDMLSRLPLAAALSGGILALAFALRGRSVRAGAAALVALLPAAAGCGIAALALGADGPLSLGVGEPGGLSPGALSVGVAILVAIGSTRTAAALDAARSERELDRGPAGVAERAAALVTPAAFLGTVIVGAAAGVLSGVGLDAARVLGVSVAGGSLVDLLVLRTPSLAGAARWLGQGSGRISGPWRGRIRWPGWRGATRRPESPTASPG